MKNQNRTGTGRAYQHAGSSPRNNDIVNGKIYVRCLDFNRDNMEQLIDKLCNPKYLSYRATIMDLLLKRISKGSEKYKVKCVIDYFNHKLQKLKIKQANAAKNLDDLNTLVELNEKLSKVIKSTKSDKMPPTPPIATSTTTDESGSINITINIEKFYNNNFYTTTTGKKK